MSDDRLEELSDAQRAAALRWREALRASEQVDTATAGRLARARALALGGGTSRPKWLWASGGLTAAALVAMLVLVLQFGGLPRFGAGDADANSADAIEVLTDDLDADFYQDLELYRWLAEDGHA